MKKNNHKFSKISIMHLIKLCLRSLLLLVVVAFYILDKLDVLASNYVLLIVVWIFLIVEMILRFFPNKLESMGCQKQFKRNYVPTGNEVDKKLFKKKDLGALWVLLIWIGLNSIFGVLYFTGIIDKGILLIISLFYSVCDIICILFFCPFQTWIMKNRCCTTCRIYNWDFMMMVTPLIFIPSLYTYSLVGVALILLIRWELTYYLRKERFSETTNESVKCINCQEKLCKHKKQLQHFLKKYYKKIMKK